MTYYQVLQAARQRTGRDLLVRFTDRNRSWQVLERVNGETVLLYAGRIDRHPMIDYLQGL